MKKVTALLIALLMVLTLVPVWSIADANSLTVSFYATTDMHGRSAQYDVSTAKEDVNSMVRVASVISEARSAYGEDNVLVVDNGDTFQGNLLAQYAATIKNQEENPMTTALKYIGYDMFVTGNHEYNYLPSVRDRQMLLLEDAGIDVLGANLTLVEDGTNLLGQQVKAGDSFYKPYALKTFTNEAGKSATIAVIGITNANCDGWDSSQNFPNLKFYSDGNEERLLEVEIQKWVDYINTNEDADLIIVSAHSGYGSSSLESQVINGVQNSSGVAIVSCGHDHSARVGTLTNKDGETVQIINGGGSNVANAVINFSFDEAGAVTGYEISTSNIALSGASVDATLAETIKPWYDEAREWASEARGDFGGGWDALTDESQGKTNDDMIEQQTHLLDLVHKAQIWATWQSEELGIEGATVSIASPVFGKNSDGTLSFVPKDGDTVSLLDVSRLYRYSNNLLVAVDMTGEQLYNWMNTVADMYACNAATGEIYRNSSDSIYGLDTFYGVDYHINVFKEKGKRLEYATYNGVDLKDYEGLIRVALNSYRIGGSYGFYEATGLDGDDCVWTASAYLGDERAPVPTLICEYIEYMGTVTPYDIPYAGSESTWSVSYDLMKGDANKSGSVNAQDASDILRHLVGLTSLDAVAMKAADVNGEAGLQASDASCILRKIVGLISDYPYVEDEAVEIRLLATSDMHGQFYPTDYTKDVSYSGTYDRGLAHVEAYVKKVRQESENVILVDAGDLVQGTPMSYYFAFYREEIADPAMKTLRTMGYDLFVPGNHEFNYGMTILQRQLSQLTAEGYKAEKQVAVSCANYLAAATNNDETRDWATWNDYAPYIIKEYDGVKVAIMGIGNPNIANWDVPANWEGIYFAGVVETYLHYEAEMKAAADIIIVVSHSGIDSSDDSDFIRELITTTDSIDLAVSGHEHRNKVTKITNSKGETIHVISPYTKGRAVGDATLTYNPATGELSVTASVNSTASLKADPDVIRMLKPYEDETWNDYMLQSIGTAAGNFSASNLGVAPSAFMDLINRVQLWGAYDRTGLNTPDDTSDDTMAQLSISAPLTSGSAANLIPEGEIVLDDMFKLYRYENWFYQITMTGKELRTWLDFAASKISGSNGNFSVDLTYYDVIYGDGFSYVLDHTLADGQRVVSMTYNGVEVADTDVFTVVVNNYRYNGGGKYVEYLNNNGCEFIANDPDRIIYSTQYDMIQGEDKGQARNLLADYITAQKNSTIYPDITSTWSIAANQSTEVRLLATSDVHGQFYPTDYTVDVSKSGTYNRSLAQVATYVKSVREESENVILVDSGDLIQGTPMSYYYAFYKSEVTDPGMLALRSIGYDMFVPGNHEFNYGLAILNRQLADLTAEATAGESQVAVCVANYLAAETNNAETKDWATWNGYAPYIIKEYDGVKVALLGMGNPNIAKWDVPANWEGIYFAGVIETYEHYKAELQAAADIVVIVSHSGIDSSPLESDFVRELIETTDGIDLVISGHEHRSTVTKIANANGDLINVISPHTKGRGMADATFSYYPATDSLYVNASYVTVQGLAADAELVELLKPYETATWNEYMLVKIGEADGNFPAANLGTAPSAFMDLINRVQLWGAYDRTGLNTPYDTSDDTMAQLSISAPLTSGSAANLIGEGDVLRGDMFKLYRYENWFYQITMTGKEVKTWLEFAATKIDTDDGGNPYVTTSNLTYYDVIYGDGFSYVINYTNEKGSRVVSMTYNDVEVTDDDVFTVVVNNYRYNGGGNYVSYLNENGCPFTANDSARIIYSTQYDMIQGEDKGQARNLLADYISQMGTISPLISSTWRLTDGSDD